ncbi:MAG: hypothetical protein QOI95_1855 [Acidimicrobiaceae bacterium]
MIGVTEERARAIAEDEARKIVAQFTHEARQEAEARVEAFGQVAIPALAREDLLNTFRDPAFQLALGRAQFAAAATDEGSDHDLLTNLLVERARRDTPRIRMAVERALEIVDRIEDDALAGLTALWLCTLVPAGGDPEVAIPQFEKVVNDVLSGHVVPDHFDWVDDLDVLDCIRISSIGSLKDYDAFFAERLPGYVCRGVEGEHEVQRLCATAVDVGFDASVIAPHWLLEGRMRLQATTRKQVIVALEDMGRTDPAADTQKLLEAARFEEVDAEAVNGLTSFITEQCPALVRIRMVWNGFPSSFSMTPVGKALAFADAKRSNDLYGLGTLQQYLGPRRSQV